MAELKRKENRQEIEKLMSAASAGGLTAYYAHIVYEDTFSADDSLESTRIIQGPEPLWGKSKQDLIDIYNNPSLRLSVSDTSDYARFVNQLENEE
jgi:hypothetical protein